MYGARERGEEGSERRRNRARKGGSNGGRGARDGAKEEGGSKRGRETSRKVPRGGHWPVLALDTLVLQMKNSEQVLLCIVMRRNLLIDRWMT